MRIKCRTFPTNNNENKSQLPSVKIHYNPGKEITANKTILKGINRVYAIVSSGSFDALDF